MQVSHKPQGFITSPVQIQGIQNTSRRNMPRIRSAQDSSATPKTLNPREIEYVDTSIHCNITYIVDANIATYDGLAHARWSRNVYHLYQETRIPTKKIEEYIKPLTEHIKTITRWKGENILETFTLMSRVGFFDQLESLSTNKVDVISLRDKFATQLSAKMDEIQITEKNANSYVSLLKSILAQINYDKRLSSPFEKLLDKIYLSLMKSTVILSSYHYKEIFQIITEIGNHINKYIGEFSLLITKHLSCMAKAEINANNELNFASYLTGMACLIRQNFKVEEHTAENLIQLINKIKFTKDTEMAIIGLQSITTIVDLKKVSLEKVENKLMECINFLKTKQLDLHQTSILLLCISRYANSLNALSDDLKKILDEHFTILIKNKDILPLNVLQLALRTFKILKNVKYPFSKFLIQLSEIFDKNVKNFLDLSVQDIHGVIIDLTKILKHLKRKLNENKIVKFTGFLNYVMPKYLEAIHYAPLAEKMNAFVTLSDLIDSGFFADKKMKQTFNDLLPMIDSKFYSLNTNQRINYLRLISLNFSLLTLEDNKITEYANKLLEITSDKIILNNFPVNLQSSILWSMLVFYESNTTSLSKCILHRFKDEISHLYEELDKKKKYGEITISASITHVLAANWLGHKVQERFDAGFVVISETQKQCLLALQTKFDELHFEEEQSINGLPPCDIVVHDKKIAIEVQGFHHFLDVEKTLKNGATILKNALLRKNNYHVIEIQIHIEEGHISDKTMKKYYKSITDILERPSHSPKVKFQ